MHTTADLLAATAKAYHGSGIGPCVLGAVLVLAVPVFPLARQHRGGRGRPHRRLRHGPEPPWPAADEETTRDRGEGVKP